MFKRIVATIEVLALVGFVAMVVLLVVKQPTQNLTALPPPTSVASGQPAAAIDPALLFRLNCSGCHGGTGGGGIGPQLRDGAVLRSFKDAASEVAYVTNGGSGMPSFKDRLSAAEIQAVVDFTRTTLQSK
jgi:mono/diheme cytochrome c family protein